MKRLGTIQCDNQKIKHYTIFFRLTSVQNPLIFKSPHIII